MKKRCLTLGLTVLSLLMLTLSTAFTRSNVLAVSTSTTPPSKTLTGYVSSAISSRQARLVGHHPGTDQLALAIGLPLRDEQALKQLLNEASTPLNPHYRHYLTQAQANQAFNPTPQQDQQVITWLKSYGLTVTHTYPNHLLVDVTGTFAQIEQVFHVTINDYTIQLNGKQITFYAPANEPTLDGSMINLIDSIVGLDDYPAFQVDVSPSASARPANNGNPDGSPPYYPQDFANAYNVNSLWNAGDTGVGQHIGIILWGPPPSSTALHDFDVQTGAQPPNLHRISVDGGSKHPVSTSVAAEAGMDVEYTSGMAPGATIDYYEAPDTKKGNTTDNGLDDALNMAGTDANNNQQISSSWGGCEASSITDPFTQQTEQILQSNTATGHDYFFSSGDNGSACVFHSSVPCYKLKDPYPQYPASSTYATSIGGTNLSIQNNSWQSEIAWDYTYSSCDGLVGNAPVGSGGGYSKLFAQPSWQVGYSKNIHRGYPDVAADADPNTGAYICYDDPKLGSICTNPGFIGNGTSLATPVWAGMIADVNQYVQSQNKLPLGFINPLLYTMSNSNPYTAYHDIIEGTNGHYQAGPKWDAVTGLGSPNLYNLAQNAASLDPSSSNNERLEGIAAVSATDVWGVGYYQDANRNQDPLIEQWDGSSWNLVPAVVPSGQSSLMSVAAVSANDVWAVGSVEDSNFNVYTLIEHWDGSAWTVVSSPNPPTNNYDTLNGVAAVSANDVWAVGVGGPGGNNDTLIEHWDGSAWTVVPSPNPDSGGFIELSGVAAISATDVWAVGWYEDSSANVYTLIEHWDGSAWTVVPSPNPDPNGQENVLSSVAAVSANDVWAVGSYGLGAGNGRTLIEHWDGSAWTVVSSLNPSPLGENGLSGVAAVSTNDVWAVGSYTDSYGYPDTLIEHWNGNAWNVVSSPNPGPGQFGGNSLTGVEAVSNSDVWAAGVYYDSNGAPFNFFEHWKGRTWNVVSCPNP